jgi:hypothetical protein
MSRINSIIKINAMATPSKAVQFRDVDSVVKMYESMEIPAFGIKQNSALNFKYQGSNIQEGSAMLCGFLNMLQDSESAAIYTLALYEDPGTRITEKTPVDLSWNFRLRDQVTGYMPGEQYAGGYGQLLNEIKVLKTQLQQLQAKEPESKLGMIGEIMEMDAVQPLLMAIGNRIADWVVPTKTELKRVSGIPGIPEDPAVKEPLVPWRDNPAIIDAIERLNLCVKDLPALLQQLADMAEKSPAKFGLYVAMFKKMK